MGCAVLISACGGTGQDNGTESTFNQEFSGLAIDGYLARSLVFLDTNNDGTRNAWEPFAFTDDEGYFSFNPNTNVDYCRENASVSEAEFCLRTNSERTDLVIRIDGGYDVLTGEPLLGQLSRRINNTSTNNVNSVIISPVSSLVANLSTEQSSRVLQNLGLTSDDLDVDYLNTDGSSSVDSQLLNVSLKIHKVVTVLSDRLVDTYTEIGDERGTPNDASSFVYSALANQLLEDNVDLNQAVGNSSAMANVLDQAEAQLREVYRRRDFDLPADLGDASNTQSFDRVIDVTGQVVQVIDAVISSDELDITSDEAKGRSRAIESIVIKAVNERGLDSTIESATQFFTNTENEDLVNILLNVLISDRVDLVSLSRNDFAGDDFDSAEEIEEISLLPDDAAPFTQVGGLQLRVSDLDLGSAPDRLRDAEIEWYFNGSETDISGSFSACVKFIEDANVDGSLGEGNTRGELVDGFWSLLGSSSENVESFNLLITVTLLGTTYQAIIKQAGTDTVGGVNYQLFRFDNGDDIDQWHSLEGMIPIDSIPTTNEACEARLPSRIGI